MLQYSIFKSETKKDIIISRVMSSHMGLVYIMTPYIIMKKIIRILLMIKIINLHRKNLDKYVLLGFRGCVCVRKYQRILIDGF